MASPLTIWALLPGLEKVPEEESRLKPPLVPETPPEPAMVSEYTAPGVYPELGMPVVRIGVTVFAPPWQDPPPQPVLDEPVLPVLYAKAPSGTASTITISISIAIPLCPALSI